MSPTRQVHGWTWKLQVFPLGNAEAGDTHVSVFLWCYGASYAFAQSNSWKTPMLIADISLRRDVLRKHSKEISAHQWSTENTGWGFHTCFLQSYLRENTALLNDDGSLDFRITFVLENKDLHVPKILLANPSEPCLVAMLENPETHFADVSLYGRDAGQAIYAHRSILSYRVKYFQKAIAFQTETKECIAHKNCILSFDDMSTGALKMVVRRIYGEALPLYCAEDKHIGLLLEMWRFATVHCMDVLREECKELVREAASPETMALCFQMAVFLGAESMQNFLALKHCGWKTPAKDVVETLTYEEMSALITRAPVTLKTLKWADAWLNHNEQRLVHGEDFLNRLKVKSVPVSELKEIADLDIIKKYASRECLLGIISTCKVL